MRLTAKLACFLVLASLGTANGQVVDRIVAQVDGQIVTQSEWDEQERWESLLESRPEPTTLSSASLERLIDRKLVLEQFGRANFLHASSEQIARQIAQIRIQLGVKNDEEWHSRLRKCSLSEEDFSEAVGEQIDVLRFIDQRFRPSVQITREEIVSYYQESLLPELRKGLPQGATLPVLQAVQDRVTGILTERRIDEMFNAWLQGLRAQSQIQRFTIE